MSDLMLLIFASIWLQPMAIPFWRA